MKTDWRALLWLVVIILLIFASGWIVGYKCRPAPIVKPGVPVVHDSLYFHDTLRLPGKTVIVYKEKKPDTAQHDSSSVPDSSICYSFDADTCGTYVRATVCSKELPPVMPLDLSTDFIIKPKTDTIRLITIKDSLIVNTSTPLLLNWKFYVGLLLAFFGGREASR
jgi:hypothetical protein